MITPAAVIVAAAFGFSGVIISVRQRRAGRSARADGGQVAAAEDEPAGSTAFAHR